MPIEQIARQSLELLLRVFLSYALRFSNVPLKRESVRQYSGVAVSYRALLETYYEEAKAIWRGSRSQTRLLRFQTATSPHGTKPPRHALETAIHPAAQ